MKIDDELASPLEIFLAIVAFMAIFCVMNGCTTLGQSSVTTLFEETVDEAGVAHTRFEAKSRGEVDASLHKMDYRWGGKENQIQVGQDAAGVTSPAQQAYLEAWGKLIANVPGMFESMVGAISRPGLTPPPVEETP